MLRVTTRKRQQQQLNHLEYSDDIFEVAFCRELWLPPLLLVQAAAWAVAVVSLAGS